MMSKDQLRVEWCANLNVPPLISTSESSRESNRLRAFCHHVRRMPLSELLPRIATAKFRHRYPEIVLPWRASRRSDTLNIYVGNLSFDTTDSQLEKAFAAYGQVSSAHIATDRGTGRARGFGFVEMGNNEEAHAAIRALDGSELQGRTLTVNEARPREQRGGGSGGGSRGGYGGGRGGW